MIKRGQIYYIENSRTNSPVDSEQFSGRPAIIVSNDKNNKFSDVVEVIYLTTQPKSDLPTHVRVCSTNRISTALCEQITSVSVSRIGDYIASCSDQEMLNIDVALAISLGIDFEDLRESSKTDSGSDVAEDTTIEEISHFVDEEYIRLAAERDIYKSQYDWLLNRFLGSD